MRLTPCKLWTGRVGTHGYGVGNDGNGTFLAHRRACEEANGPPPQAGLDAAHSTVCVSKLCVEGSHLRWATRSANMQDKVAAGTHNRGERNPLSKLTDAQVRELRGSSERGIDAAARFGVSKAAISQARSGKTYAHV